MRMRSRENKLMPFFRVSSIFSNHHCADVPAVDAAIDDELCGASDTENCTQNNAIDFIVCHLFHRCHAAGPAIGHFRSASVS